MLTTRRGSEVSRMRKAHGQNRVERGYSLVRPGSGDMSALFQGRLKVKKAMRKILGILLLTMGLASTLRAQSGSPVQYFYDDLGRLVKVVDQNGNFATYSYDAVGNLLSITRAALPGNNGLAILNFTPQQGPVGTTVTIQGQGFSATPSADTVEFNGTPAVVTAASASTLTVTVPTGATTGPISVTVASVTATISPGGRGSPSMR